MLKTVRHKTAIGVFSVYFAGYWFYLVSYVWEHWARYGDYPMFAYYANMRAIIWPVWAILSVA